MLKISLVAALLMSAAPAAAGRAGPGAIAATAVASVSATKLTGDVTAAVWDRVPAVGGFQQREPNDGSAPSFPTEVQVAYDASTLYVAVRAHDPEPGRLVGLRTRRDAASPSDWIKVIVDSFHDRRTAFEFGVNPAGIKEDRYWYNDANDDVGWDAVWDVSVSREKDAWRAEFRIPFSQLRFRPSSETVFGFAVVREIARLNEIDTWPLLSKSANGFVSSFGELRDLHLAESLKRLEVVPYVVGQIDTQPTQPGNPLIRPRDQRAAVGADLKYAVQPGITLTATVNPDFGQVEADPAVVNLSGFETYFAERRPFFVEGSGMFAFDLDCSDGACSGLFYPRRIGRAPRGSPTLHDGMYASVPQQTTILGAAKLTGHLGRFSFGALDALTADEKATVVNGTLLTHESVEPLTSYSVLRARREFTNQSTIGFMLAGAVRRLSPATTFLPDRAVTGGLDWDWRLSKQYAVQGYWVGSDLHGSTEAIRALQESTVHGFQRPDASYLGEDPSRTAMTGSGGFIAFSKIAGKAVRFNSNVGFKTPGLDINDLGFMQRADTRSMSNWVQWRHEVPTKYVRSFRINLNEYGVWNFGGDRLGLGGNINAHWVFANNWSTGVGLTRNLRGFDDRASRGVGPGAYRNAEWGYWNYVSSDERKPLSLNYFINLGGDRLGTKWIAVNPGATYRPASFISMTGGLGWNRSHVDAQWIENTPDGRYIFGRLLQTTVSLTGRLNYTLSPNLTVQVYVAPFVSAGAYSGFKALVNGRAAGYRDRYAPVAYASNPDFNYHSFRTTNVVRWEYKPGSALFLVWQQGREETAGAGQFEFTRDFGRVFAVPARNVLLAKWSYWINP